MDALGANAPDQLEDDRLFERLFSDWGEQGRMAALMGVSRTTFARQLRSDDERHASDYHRGRRAAYAAGYRQDEKGEQIKAGIDEAYEAGARDRVGATVAAQVKFPASLAHDVIEIELNPVEASAVPIARRLRMIRKLKRELAAYEEQLASRSGLGSEREAREAEPQRPRPVEAKVS